MLVQNPMPCSLIYQACKNPPLSTQRWVNNYGVKFILRQRHAVGVYAILTAAQEDANQIHQNPNSHNRKKNEANDQHSREPAEYGQSKLSNASIAVAEVEVMGAQATEEQHQQQGYDPGLRWRRIHHRSDHALLLRIRSRCPSLWLLLETIKLWVLWLWILQGLLILLIRLGRGILLHTCIKSIRVWFKRVIRVSHVRPPFTKGKACQKGI